MINNKQKETFQNNMQTRPSIQGDLMYPQYKFNKHAYTSQPNPITHQIFKNNSQQFTPISKIKNNNYLFDQLCTEGIELPLEFKPQINSGKDLKKERAFVIDDDINQAKIVSAQSSDDFNQDYRITFSKKLPNSFNGSKGEINGNKRFHRIESCTPLSNSNYQGNFGDSPTVSHSYKQNYLLRQQAFALGITSYPKLPKQKIGNIKAGQIMNKEINKQQLNEDLYQVIKDLENHNKNMMKETKKTIENFQIYIEDLLKNNAEMQSKLLEYQDIIQMLENQKLQLLERQKQRQIMMQKILTKKMSTTKQRQNKSYPPSTLTNKKKEQSQNKKREQQIIRLKQQLNKKQQNIKLLQQLIAEKEVIIKNMANFNNEMCLQIMQLKNKNNLQTCASMQSLKSKQKQKYKDERQQKYLTFKPSQIKELNLFKYHDYVGQKNQFNNQEISTLINKNKYNNNQFDISNIPNIQQLQSETIKRQKNVKQIYQSNNNSIQINRKNKNEKNIYENKKMISDKNCSYIKEDYVKNKYLDYKLSSKNQRSKLDPQQKQPNLSTKSQVSSIGQNSDIKVKQLLNMSSVSQQQQKQGQGTIKKIEQSLQTLCDKIKNEDQKQKYKDIMCNVIKKLSNDKYLQIEGSKAYSSGSSGVQENINLQKTKKLKQQNKKTGNKNQQGDKSMTNLVSRNEQILKKIKQVKKKVENHTKKPSLTSQCIQESNDENDRYIGIKQGIGSYSYDEGLLQLDRINEVNTGECDAPLGGNTITNFNL